MFIFTLCWHSAADWKDRPSDQNQSAKKMNFPDKRDLLRRPENEVQIVVVAFHLHVMFSVGKQHTCSAPATSPRPNPIAESLESKDEKEKSKEMKVNAGERAGRMDRWMQKQMGGWMEGLGV